MTASITPLHRHCDGCGHDHPSTEVKPRNGLQYCNTCCAVPPTTIAAFDSGADVLIQRLYEKEGLWLPPKTDEPLPIQT